MPSVMSVIIMSGAFIVSSVWAGNETAHDTVVHVIDSFRTNIIANNKELANNPKLLTQRVDKILTPVIDFDVFSKKVMGKYYRHASKEQRVRFAKITKDTFLKTYGGSLLDLAPDKIKILPFHPQQGGREMKVDVDFQLSDGSPLNLNFYMQDYGKNDWKLSNVVINNINFGLTFRRQFAVMMQHNHNDIDSSIDAWKQSLEKKL